MTTEVTPQDQVANVQAADAVERASERPVAHPQVEIIDSETEIRLIAEMPGVDESQADATLERNILTIRGTTEAVQPQNMEMVHVEYVPVDYERSFTLSDEIDRDAIEATVKQGVLHLRLPKLKESQSRKIAIKAG